MSKLETNQVDPATGTTLTLGTSGDTIAIPSGVTIANSGTATGFGGVNTPVVNAIRFGTSQAISATTWTRIVFNSERLDTGSIYDNSTGVATIAEAGKYLVMSTIGVRNLTGSSEYFGAAIQNTDRTQAGIDSIAAYVSGASGYGWKNIHLSHIKSYSANDTIAIWCYATEAVDLKDESQNLTICKIIE